MPGLPPRLSYRLHQAAQADGTWAEWVAGKVVRMTPVSFEHQDVVGFLDAVMRAYVDATGTGRLLAEPFVMKTGPELPGRSPDLFFVAREHLSRLRSHSLDGPADLVVEVISPESLARDRVDWSRPPVLDVLAAWGLVTPRG